MNIKNLFFKKDIREATKKEYIDKIITMIYTSKDWHSPNIDECRMYLREKIRVIENSPCEKEFYEKYDKFRKGEITEFKKWLESLNGESTILFMQWLYSNDLKL